MGVNTVAHMEFPWAEWTSTCDPMLRADTGLLNIATGTSWPLSRLRICASRCLNSMGDPTRGPESQDDRTTDTGMPWAVNGSLAAMKVSRAPPLAHGYGTHTSVQHGSSLALLFQCCAFGAPCGEPSQQTYAILIVLKSGIARRRQEGLANAVGGETQTWTFSSSGWLFVYFFGCIRALRDLERHRCAVGFMTPKASTIAIHKTSIPMPWRHGMCFCRRDVYVVGSSGGACAGSFLFLQDSDACDQASVVHQ